MLSSAVTLGPGGAVIRIREGLHSVLQLESCQLCFCQPADFLDSCRANTLLAELDDEEDLPEPDDDDDENEDDNQEDQEYEEVLVCKKKF